MDEAIMSSSKVFQELPDEHVSTPPAKSKKRTCNTFELSSPEIQQPKRKIICLLLSSDSDSEWVEDS